MSTVVKPAAERILLHEISWKAYEALLESWAERPVRTTYDHGTLEIMSPLLIHERIQIITEQLIDAYTEELNIPRMSGGGTTFKQEAHKRGLDPDACYWIQHERVMRGKDDFDPDTDPPPDLAIEVDITHSSLDRMSIYATLGVPEVWRFDEHGLTINLLQGGGYVVSERSVALPGLPPAEVIRFLEMRAELDEVSLIRSFREWVRQQGRKKPARKARRPRKK